MLSSSSGAEIKTSEDRRWLRVEAPRRWIREGEGEVEEEKEKFEDDSIISGVPKVQYS